MSPTSQQALLGFIVASVLDIVACIILFYTFKLFTLYKKKIKNYKDFFLAHILYHRLELIAYYNGYYYAITNIGDNVYLVCISRNGYHLNGYTLEETKHKHLTYYLIDASIEESIKMKDLVSLFRVDDYIFVRLIRRHFKRNDMYNRYGVCQNKKEFVEIVNRENRKIKISIWMENYLKQS